MPLTFAQICTFIPVYAVVMAILYLCGYWYSFDVNPFSYIDVSQLIIYSIKPFLAACIFGLIGCLSGYTASKIQIHTKESKSSGIVALRRTIKVIDIIAFSATILVAIFGGPLKWLVLPCMFSIAISGLIIIVQVVSPKEDKFKNFPIILIFAVIFSLLQSYGFGKFESINIKSGIKYQHIESQMYKETLSQFRYIGTLKDTVFLYNPNDSSISLYSSQALMPYKFMKN